MMVLRNTHRRGNRGGVGWGGVGYWCVGELALKLVNNECVFYGDAQVINTVEVVCGRSN